MALTTNGAKLQKMMWHKEVFACNFPGHCGGFCFQFYGQMLCDKKRKSTKAILSVLG
jgi:hypothetical protein